MGFADLLGMADNAAIQSVTINGKDKDKNIVAKGTRYCLLPISAKEGKKSIKSEYGVGGAAARALYAEKLNEFSTRAFAGVSGAVASGKMAIASVVMKDNGRMQVNLVPNNAVLVQAPMDIESIRKFLAANPEAAKKLTA